MNDKNDVADFCGLHVAAFESRQAGEIGKLIEKFGGIPHVSPSIREVPIDPNPHAVDFVHRLITGQIDVVIFLTGVGFKALLEAVSKTVDRQRYLDALSDVTTVARGPKPVVAMKEFGLNPTIKVPEPNTWRELLTTIDSQLAINNQIIAIQEYGKTNPSLVAGLEARGATVMRVPVYRWELPENCAPLLENIRAIVAGKIDVVMFTSAAQIFNLMNVAEKENLLDSLRAKLERMLIVSVGPTTSETLRDLNLRVDVEPEHPKMGPMVMAAARAAAARFKPRIESARPRTPAPASPAQVTLDTSAPWYSGPFMKACRREPSPVTPVWLMRQAGRYMAEYRAVREKTTFLELCKNPALCSEVMVTAVRRLGVDAAIIFSDLLPILEPLGFNLEFAPGDGPVIHNPIREARDIDRVRELESLDELWFVVDTVRQTRADLPAHLPLIGFSGSPFTLASYAIEGGSSRNFLRTKTLMYSDPGAWHALMERLSRAVVRYLIGQIHAGAQCVQLFDSWVGCLGVDDYRTYVLPHMQSILSQMPAGFPVINFGTGNPMLLPLMAEAGGSVIGVDWRIRLDDAWNLIGHDRAVQGNLDPATLLADVDYLRAQVRRVLQQAGGRPGHIFNLGHGILPNTHVDHAIAVVDAVHEFRAT